MIALVSDQAQTKVYATSRGRAGSSALLNDLSYFSSGVDINVARCVEDHHRAFLVRVGRPVWQTLVIWIARASKRGPRSRTVRFELAHFRPYGSYHALAQIDVIEDEWNFHRVRRAQSHHRRLPGPYVQVGRCFAQRRPAFGQPD